MFATDVLLKEHDVILKMLDATDAVGRRLMRGGNVSPETLDGLRIVILARSACHEAPEHTCLTKPLMVGVPGG